jgi:2-succinyl-5-enolpyruvyl-6-hydroxy-3-cyclohexene-1-carboxylate synthase
MHDMNGLLALRDLNPWCVLVVVNNDGGGIFHTLPVREREPAFTRYFATPHGLDFKKAADLYGLPFHSAGSLQELQRSLEKALEGGAPAIVEVRTRRGPTHDQREAVVRSVVAAVEGLGAP